MTRTRDHSSPAVYNPDLLGRQQLIDGFVARHELLDRLLDELRSCGPTGAVNHHLLIGYRGMGKTTLLRRLGYAIQDDPHLRAHWIPLEFPEEQYNVATLSDLYLNCVDALGDALEAEGAHAAAESIDERIARMPQDEARRAFEARALLRALAAEQGRRLVLLIDNVDQVLERLDEREQWALRSVLSEDQSLVFIGASAKLAERTSDYESPFYAFFVVHRLRALNEAQAREVLLRLARTHDAPHVATTVREEPGRIRTLHTLTGGNPRTIALLFQVMARGGESDVRGQLEQLLDQCTPLYKARFEALPQEAQKTLDALALYWDPCTAAQLTESARLDRVVVDAQLTWLVHYGLVEQLELPGVLDQGYQVAERFFNIWYLMRRATRRRRNKLVWLVRFLQLFFGADQLQDHARRYLDTATARRDRGRGTHDAEWGLVLADSLSGVAAGSILSRALHGHALVGMLHAPGERASLAQQFDLDGADQDLRDPATRHEAAAELQSLVDQLPVPEDLDRERLRHDLACSYRASLWTKLDALRALQHGSEAALRHAADEWRKQTEWLRRSLGAPLLAVWERAFCEGYLAHAAHTEEAEVAALALNCPALVPVIWAFRAYSSSDADDVATLEAHATACATSPPLVWNALGLCLKEQERYEEAEAAYRQAIALDPTLALPWNNLGALLADHLERYEEAEAAYRQAIALDPTLALPWNNLGALLSDHLERYEEAEAAYRQAIALDPTYASPWNNLGLLLAKHQERYEEAEAAYRQAIELGEARLCNHVAWLRYQRGRVDEETERLARRAVDELPDNVNAVHTLATVLAARGQWDEAAALGARFLREGGGGRLRAPSFDEVLCFFAEAVRSGRAREALGLLQEVELDDRWLPLAVALEVIAHGHRDGLEHHAPEVAQPAAELVARLAPGLPESPESMP